MKDEYLKEKQLFTFSNNDDEKKSYEKDKVMNNLVNVSEYFDCLIKGKRPILSATANPNFNCNMNPKFPTLFGNQGPIMGNQGHMIGNSGMGLGLQQNMMNMDKSESSGAGNSLLMMLQKPNSPKNEKSESGMFGNGFNLLNNLNFGGSMGSLNTPSANNQAIGGNNLINDLLNNNNNTTNNTELKAPFYSATDNILAFTNKNFNTENDESCLGGNNGSNNSPTNNNETCGNNDNNSDGCDPQGANTNQDAIGDKDCANLMISSTSSNNNMMNNRGRGRQQYDQHNNKNQFINQKNNVNMMRYNNNANTNVRGNYNQYNKQFNTHQFLNSNNKNNQQQMQQQDRGRTSVQKNSNVLGSNDDSSQNFMSNFGLNQNLFGDLNQNNNNYTNNDSNNSNDEKADNLMMDLIMGDGESSGLESCDQLGTLKVLVPGPPTPAKLILFLVGNVWR